MEIQIINQKKKKKFLLKKNFNLKIVKKIKKIKIPKKKILETPN